MLRHLMVLFVATFVVGMFSGFLLFLSSEKKVESTPVQITTYNPNSFEIIGYTYGGCENFGCVSYRLESDGGYTYIARGQNGADVRYNDFFSDKQRTDLTNLVLKTDIAMIASSTFSGTCPAAYDANAYRYEIRVGDNRYSIDSCIESLDGEALFSALSNYFEVFSALYRTT